MGNGDLRSRGGRSEIGVGGAEIQFNPSLLYLVLLSKTSVIRTALSLCQLHYAATRVVKIIRVFINICVDGGTR